MARIRTIKPEFWQDEKLALLPAITRLVFLGLVSQADDAGRLVDNTKLLDGLLFPYTDDSCGESLETLASLGRITRYCSASGQPLIQLAGWEKHQNVQKPSRYVLPGPGDATLPTPSGDSPETVGRVPVSDLGPTTNDQRPTTVDPREEVEGSAPTAPTEGRTDALSEMQEEVNRYAREISDPVKRKTFNADARMIVRGEDLTAWRDHTGAAVPWPDRPRLLRLALARLEARTSDSLRGGLRYVIPQQYDPTAVTTSAELAERRAVAMPAVAEARAASDIATADRQAEAEAVERARRAEEDARIAAWEAANELEAARLRKEAREEVEQNAFAPAGMREKITDETYRARALEVIRAA